MNELRQETVATYDNAATKWEEYFNSMDARADAVEVLIDLVGTPQGAKVLEIGCANGHDAKEFISRGCEYIGFDISEELIRLARLSTPGAKFEVGDAVTYKYPEHQDIVFAHASLLHLNRNEIKNVFGKVRKSLRQGGVLFLSMKYAPDYTESVQESEHGKRLFYLYSPELIEELAGEGFECVHQFGPFLSRKTKSHSQWFELGLRKNIRGSLNVLVQGLVFSRNITSVIQIIPDLKI